MINTQSQGIVEKISERLEGLKKFAATNQPLLETQRHLDEGSSERAYWHAGYVYIFISTTSLQCMHLQKLAEPNSRCLQAGDDVGAVLRNSRTLIVQFV